MCNYLYLFKDITFTYCFSFIYFLMFFIYLFLFDVIYMFLPLHVLCSKIAIKN